MPYVFPKVCLELKVERLGGSWMGLCSLHACFGMGVSSGSSPFQVRYIDMLNIFMTALVIQEQ